MSSSDGEIPGPSLFLWRRVAVLQSPKPLLNYSHYKAQKQIVWKTSGLWRGVGTSCEINSGVCVCVSEINSGVCVCDWLLFILNGVYFFFKTLLCGVYWIQHNLLPCVSMTDDCNRRWLFSCIPSSRPGWQESCQQYRLARRWIFIKLKTPFVGDPILFRSCWTPREAEALCV